MQVFVYFFLMGRITQFKLLIYEPLYNSPEGFAYRVMIEEFHTHGDSVSFGFPVCSNTVYFFILHQDYGFFFSLSSR